MNNNKVGCLYSWPAIIIALICFWPIGLVLIVKRLSSDKTAMVNSSGKGLKIGGIALIVIGIFGIIGSLDSFEVGNIILFLFFIGGGAVLVRKAKKIQIEGDNIKRYLSMIVNSNVRQLDMIASATGKQYDTVKTDIQKMIDNGFLRSAYINETTREVILATPVRADVNVQQQAVSTAAPVQLRVVACPCCGANNTISGALGECEYCGSPLK